MLSQTLGETIQPNTTYELRVKVRNNERFAIQLFPEPVPTTQDPPPLLASFQYIPPPNSGPDIQWHERVLRYHSGSNPPTGYPRIVLIAGNVPPSGGGGDPGPDSTSGDDQDKDDRDGHTVAATADQRDDGDESQGSLSGGQSEEEPDPVYSVRFDDVRLIRTTTMPRFLHQGTHYLPELNAHAHGVRIRPAGSNVFMSEDWITDGTNKFLFVGNDPIDYSDPTGLWKLRVTAAPNDGSFSGAGTGVGTLSFGSGGVRGPTSIDLGGAASIGANLQASGSGATAASSLLSNATDPSYWARSDFSSFIDPAAGLSSGAYHPLDGQRFVIPVVGPGEPTWADTFIDSLWYDFTETMHDAWGGTRWLARDWGGTTHALANQIADQMDQRDD